MHARSFRHFLCALWLVCGTFFISSCGLKSKSAPAWELKDLQGKTVKLSDFRGKVVVLNFWATWCPPCNAEIPDFIAAQKGFAGKDVVLIGISQDSLAPAGVADFVQKKGMNYLVLMGSDDVAASYGIEGIPSTFVLDRTGNILETHVGMLSERELTGAVEKALAAK